MEKEIHKIYFYDRWLNFSKEANDALIYESTPNSDGNIIRLEYNKENGNIKVLYSKKGTTIGKLNIIKDNDKYSVNYKNLECEFLEKEDDLHVNLLYELNMTIRNQITSDIKIKLSKKKNLNKICYLEPTFPLDEDLNIKNLKMTNNQLEYLLNLFRELRYYLPVISKQIQKNIEEINQNNNRIIKELNVPEELQMYDRTYKFVSKDDYNLNYENTSGGLTTLKIELNPYETKIKKATIEFIPKNDKEVKDKIEFSHEINNNIIIKYINFNKIRMELNREACSARLNTYAEFDNNGETIRNEVYINSSSKDYKLYAHPVFRNKYLDEEGLEYTIGNSDYARFHGFLNFICPIVQNLEKIFYKEYK